jgi:hypothetical protein
LGDRMNLLAAVIRRRVLHTEQQWALTQPFVKQLVTAEAKSLGHDIDEALSIVGVSRAAASVGLRIDVESTLHAAAGQAIDVTSRSLKLLADAVRHTDPA